MEKLLSLLKSRKFWVAVATVTADVIVSYVPSLADVQSDLIKVITAIGLILIGAIAGEDMAYWLGAGKDK